MNLKSVLCAATMLAAAGVAQAFPDYTLYPADGSEFNSAMNMATFNLTFSGVNVVVAEGAHAILQSEDMDEAESTGFVNFMNSGTIIINFDTEEIVTNGQWTLTIPAGSMTADGEANPEITAIYTLSDPTLGMGDFPQIELLSINPPDGKELAYWGGPTLTKVELKTSDDAAVNYIEWTLYDVTDGVDKYKRQGNDNRYDFNRYQHHDDIWADGLFIALSEEIATKLVLDHTYRLDIRFCGIGYDDATNQYPNPQQIEASTELVTSVYYKGLIPAQEYAKAEYESVEPDPATYDIDDINLAFFHVTYTAPAKPVEFNYSIGMGIGAAPAGTWEPFEGMTVDENGLCSKWTFTFDPAVIANKTGTIYTTIQSMDADGLYVRGNAEDMEFDDINYGILWNCNLGAPDLISVSPLAGSTVESLSSITITNQPKQQGSTALPMNYSYNTNEKIRITTRQGKEIRVLENYEDLVYTDDLTQVTWNFEPITENGNYVLIIPKYYFSLGEEFDGASSNLTTFEYIVDNGDDKVVYDRLPAEIVPANDAVVESISNVKLTFAQVTYMLLEDTPEGSLYKVVDGEDVLVESVQPTDFNNLDWFNPTIYDFDFTPVTEPGQYKVVIPKATFYDAAYDESMGEYGSANPEIVLNYTIEGGNVPSDVEYTLIPAAVSPENGASVEEIRMVTVTFDQATYCNLSGTGEMAKLYKVVDGEEVLLAQEDPFSNWENDYYNPTMYDYYFTAIEPGEYKVVIPQGSFWDAAYEESEGKVGVANPEIVYNYTVVELPAPVYDVMPVDVTPANDTKVDELGTVTLTFGDTTFLAQVAQGFAVDFAKVYLYKVVEGQDELISAIVPVDNKASHYLTPTIYDINVIPAITEIGVYKVVVPEGTFGTQKYVDSFMRTGNANPEFVLNYVIGTVGVDAIFGSDAAINVYDVNGVQVLKDANVEAAKELKSGLYIINGQKVMIRR